MEKAERDIQFINQIYFRMLDFSNNCLDVHFSSGSNKKVPVTAICCTIK